MKFENKYLPILLSATLALGVGIGGWLNVSRDPGLVASNASKSKLNSLIDFINNEYVDDVNTDSIVNLTVDNILAKLDPHSVYIPPSVQTQVAESMKGDFVGIGINFYMYKDTVAVIKPVVNGPSAKAGIQLSLSANSQKAQAHIHSLPQRRKIRLSTYTPPKYRDSTATKTT